MPKQLKRKKLEERDGLIRKWFQAGVTGTEIQKRIKHKYGIGIHSNTLKAIREEIGVAPARPGRRKPKADPKPETALVVSAAAGLVPAQECSNRLRALITHVADAMIEDGVLSVAIDGREVVVVHSPEEQLFEV